MHKIKGEEMKKAQGTTAITKWDEQLAKMAQDAAKVVEGLAGGGSFIKTRGGLFYKDMPIPDNKMRVVVVDHVLINAFYEGKFDEAAWNRRKPYRPVRHCSCRGFIAGACRHFAVPAGAGRRLRKRIT